MSSDQELYKMRCLGLLYRTSEVSITICHTIFTTLVIESLDTRSILWWIYWSWSIGYMHGNAAAGMHSSCLSFYVNQLVNAYSIAFVTKVVGQVNSMVGSDSRGLRAGGNRYSSVRRRVSWSTRCHWQALWFSWRGRL